MKYKNTSTTNIFAQVNGETIIVAPGAEVQSNEPLEGFGLTSMEVKKAKPIPPKKKSTPKPKPVKTNELPNTDKTED
jgi:hypothetical protein